jgi:hypothetical protein
MLLPGFCENSNTTLAQRSRFCYADPDNMIELRALTNELSPLCSNYDQEASEES